MRTLWGAIDEKNINNNLIPDYYIYAKIDNTFRGRGTSKPFANGDIILSHNNLNVMLVKEYQPIYTN
jgi:hypothetical protein